MLHPKIRVIGTTSKSTGNTPEHLNNLIRDNRSFKFINISDVSGLGILRLTPKDCTVIGDASNKTIKAKDKAHSVKVIIQVDGGLCESLLIKHGG